MSHFLWVISMIHSKLEEHTCNLRDFFKGSPDRSHFIFEINVGKSRIRQRTTLNLYDAIFNQFWADLEFNFGVVLCRIRFFPTLISKIKWLGSELPLIRNFWLADFLLHFISWFMKFVLNNVFIFLSIPSFDFQKVVCCLKNCYTRISYQLEHFK